MDDHSTILLHCHSAGGNVLRAYLAGCICSGKQKAIVWCLFFVCPIFISIVNVVIVN